MDDIVLRGMAKWPNVPAVYGWLALDRRGNWLLKGERIANPGVIAFIDRNYGHDEEGRWFFQNGPQRVFVALDYAPLVYRVANPAGEPLAIETHTGRPVMNVRGAWVDESGFVVLETEHGAGTIHDGDLDQLLSAFADPGGNSLDEDALEARLEQFERGQAPDLSFRYHDRTVKVEPIQSDEAPQRFGYRPQPEPPPGHPECC